MGDVDCLQRLVTSSEYSALQRLKPEFNFFALLGDVLREPAWSRIFASVLDATYPHGLGDRGLREWLTWVVAEQRSRTQTVPPFFVAVPPSLTCRTTVEYRTPAGRRIDILVRLLDERHRVVGVLGIENKLDAPEAPAQIADYQAALAEVFPNAQKLIVYLTPDGRPPRTAATSADCPCCPASYRTMVGACRALARDAEPKVALLLDSLWAEIETVVLGADRMKAEARALVDRLWADPEHQRAIRLLLECVPTQRQLWERELLPRVRSLDLTVLDSGDVSFYPDRASSPYEIKFACGGPLAEQSARLGFHPAYMLRCEDALPDVGSEFTLRLVAWCESQAARKRVQRLELIGVPRGGVPKAWSSWEPIWVGGAYPLRDLAAGDAAGLAELLQDGVKLTHAALEAAVAKLNAAGGTKQTS